MLKTRIFALLVLLFGATNAHAYFYDGNHLLRACKGNVGERGEGMCLGFVAGVWGYHHNLQLAGIAKRDVCMPSNVNASQAQKVFLNHMQRHPEELNLPATLIVIKALREAFPCR